MIFSVVERGAKIGHGKSCQKTACRGFADSAFDGGNPVARNGAAKNIVDEFDAFVAFGRFELHAAHAELPVSAGLFFVFAFGVGAPANGFAIRHSGRF